MDESPSTQPSVPSRVIIDACLAMGFALAGIARAEPTRRRTEYLDWLAAGSHGDMDYLVENIEERLDVGVLLPGVRSVIVVADQYADAPVAAEHQPTDGTIAKYARAKDYHEVIRKRLWTLVDQLREHAQGHTFRPFVDTGPALEREHAVRAGLGGAFIGKHTLAISPSLGSYLLLGGVATTLQLEPTGASDPPEDRCGSCTRCIDACPTGAITPFRVEATRCISYLTLEHRGTITPDLHAGMGSWLIGCDVCQDVCPFNHAPSAAPRIHPAYSSGRSALPILEVLGWTDADRSRVLSQSAAKRATLAMLKRNALIAAGNAIERGATNFVEPVRRLADDPREPELVRDTARQVLERLALD